MGEEGSIYRPFVTRILTNDIHGLGEIFGCSLGTDVVSLVES